MRRSGVTIIELIVSCVIIFTLIGAGAAYFTKTLKTVREVTLRNQLSDIRLSLRLYHLFNNRYPDDIRRLLAEKIDMMPYSGAALKKKYVESVGTDNEGFPQDPFGNRFLYRADLGEVKSQTKGYENW
jgi:type II secretory pathway pseudopilin PulG